MNYQSCLVFILLIKLSNQFKSITKSHKSAIPFNCDRENGYDLKKLNFNIFYLDELIYIFFDQKMIIFNQPYLKKNRYSQNNLITFYPFLINDIKTNLDLNSGILGVFNKKGEDLYSIHSISSNETYTCYLIDFKRPTDVTARELCEKVIMLKYDHIVDPNVNWRYYHYLNTRESLILKYNKGLKDKSELFIQHLSIDQQNRSATEKLDYKVGTAAINLKDKNNLLIYEINSNDYSKSLFLNEIQIEQDNKMLILNYKNKFEISMENLFGCTQEINDVEQIKGNNALEDAYD